MDGKTQAVKGKAVVADFLELGANAFAGGVMVAIALAAITLALATSAQAAPVCVSDAAPQEPRSAVLTPAEEYAASVGALWARPRR